MLSLICHLLNKVYSFATPVESTAPIKCNMQTDMIIHLDSRISFLNLTVRIYSGKIVETKKMKINEFVRVL